MATNIEREKKKIEMYSFLSAFSNNLVSPIISIYALTIGATSQIIGMMSAFPSFANLLGQLFFSNISKSLKYVVLGTILWALFWVAIGMTKSPTTLLILLIAQAYIGAMSSPAWSAFLARAIPSNKRGIVNSDLTIYSSLGGFIASLAGGYFVQLFGFNIIIFVFVTIFSILSVVPLMKIKEEKTSSKQAKKRKEKNSDPSKLMKLIAVASFLNFGVGIAGPMFTPFLKEELNATTLDISIVNAVGLVAYLLFLRSIGYVTDIFDKKKVIIAGILLIVMFPLPYIFAKSRNDMNLIYFGAFLSNIGWAMFNIATVAYLFDVAPEPLEKTTTFYSFTVGFFMFLGNLLSGFLVEYMGYRALFELSILLRFTSIFLFMEIKNVKERRRRIVFPLIGFIHENVADVYSFTLYQTHDELTKRISKFLKMLRIIR